MNGNTHFQRGSISSLLGVLRVETCEYTLKLMEITEKVKKRQIAGGVRGVLERVVPRGSRMKHNARAKNILS
jgi:hypothetical protein